MPDKDKQSQLSISLCNKYKRNAKYYEECIKDIRNSINNLVEGSIQANTEIIYLARVLNEILEHTHEPIGVNLEQPNYGLYDEPD